MYLLFLSAIAGMITVFVVYYILGTVSRLSDRRTRQSVRTRPARAQRGVSPW